MTCVALGRERRRTRSPARSGDGDDDEQDGAVAGGHGVVPFAADAVVEVERRGGAARRPAPAACPAVAGRRQRRRAGALKKTVMENAGPPAEQPEPPPLPSPFSEDDRLTRWTPEIWRIAVIMRATLSWLVVQPCSSIAGTGSAARSGSVRALDGDARSDGAAQRAQRRAGRDRAGHLAQRAGPVEAALGQARDGLDALGAQAGEGGVALTAPYAALGGGRLGCDALELGALVGDLPVGERRHRDGQQREARGRRGRRTRRSPPAGAAARCSGRRLTAFIGGPPRRPGRRRRSGGRRRPHRRVTASYADGDGQAELGLQRRRRSRGRRRPGR